MNVLKAMWRIWLAVAALLVLTCIVVSVTIEGANSLSFVMYFMVPLFVVLAVMFCWPPKPLYQIGKSRAVVNHPFCGP